MILSPREFIRPATVVDTETNKWDGTSRPQSNSGLAIYTGEKDEVHRFQVGKITSTEVSFKYEVTFDELPEGQTYQAPFSVGDAVIAEVTFSRTEIENVSTGQK